MDKHPVTHLEQKFILPSDCAANDTVGTVTRYLKKYPLWHLLYYGETVTDTDFTCSIVAGNGDSAFSINATTGDLTVLTPASFTADRDITVRTTVGGRFMDSVCTIERLAEADIVYLDSTYVGTEAGTKAQPYTKFKGKGLGNGTAGKAYLYKRGTVTLEENLKLHNAAANAWITVGAWGQGARPVIDGQNNSTADRFIDFGTFSTTTDGSNIRVFDIETVHDASTTWYPYQIQPFGTGLEMHRLKSSKTTFENGLFWFRASDSTGYVNKQGLIRDCEAFDFRLNCRGFKLEGGGILLQNCHAFSAFAGNTSVGISAAHMPNLTFQYCSTESSSSQGFQIRAGNCLYEYCVIDGAASSLIGRVILANAGIPNGLINGTSEFRNIIVKNSTSKIISFQREGGTEEINGLKFTNIIVQGGGAIGAEMLDFSKNNKLTNCVLAGLTGTGVRVFSGSSGHELEGCTIVSTATGINATEPLASVKNTIYNSLSGTITVSANNSTNVSDFVGASDYRIESGSALIGAAARLSLEDALGNDRVDPTTIGAYEFIPVYSLSGSISIPTIISTASLASGTDIFDLSGILTIPAIASTASIAAEVPIFDLSGILTIPGIASTASVASIVSYTLDFEIDPVGYGSGNQIPAGPHPPGLYVSTSASAARGKRFVAWYDGETLLSTLSPRSYQIFSNKTLRLLFENLPELYVNETISPLGSGSVTKGGPYPYYRYETATLTAVPAPGYIFVSWEIGGDIVSELVTYSFHLDNIDVNVTANFKLEKKTLSLTVSPPGSGTVSGGGAYDPGESVAVSSANNIGWVFAYWMQGTTVISEIEDFTYVMTASNSSLVAFFESMGAAGFDPAIVGDPFYAPPGLQLYVNGAFVDMPVNFETQLNRFNPIFQTEGVIRDDYTLPISLPHSDHNAKLLGNPSVVENRSRFQLRTDAVLYYNGMPQIRGQLRIKSPVNSRVITVNFVSGVSEISADLAEKSLREIMDEEIVIHATDFNRAITLTWQSAISTTYAIKVIGTLFEAATLTDLIDALNENLDFPYTASTPGTDQLTITPDVSNEFLEFWVDFVGGSEWRLTAEPAYTESYRDTYSTFMDQFREASPDNRFRFAANSNIRNFFTEDNIKAYSIINYYTADGVAKNHVYQPSLPIPLSGTFGNPKIQNNTSIAPYVTVEYVLQKIAAFYGIQIIAPFLGTDQQKMIIDHPNTLDRSVRYIQEQRIILFERSFNVADLVPNIKVNEFLKALQGMGYALVYDQKKGTLEYFLRDPILTQATYVDLSGRFSELDDIQNQQRRGVTLRHADDTSDTISTIDALDAENGKKAYIIGNGEKIVESGFSVPVVLDNSLTFPPDISVLDNVVTKSVNPSDSFPLRLAFSFESFFFYPAMTIFGDQFSLSWYGAEGLAATTWNYWKDLENESPTIKLTLYLTEIEALTAPYWLQKVLIDRTKYMIQSYELSIKDTCEWHECEAILVKTPYSDRNG